MKRKRTKQSVILAALLLGALSASAQTEKISNGGFEENLNSWNTYKLPDSDATISATRDTNNPISGTASARIDIGGSDDPAASESWHLQFFQNFTITNDHFYNVTFKIKASEPVVVTATTARTWESFMVGTEPQTVRLSGIGTETGTGALRFFFGKTQRDTQIWIDDVSVMESSASGTTATVTVDFNAPEEAADLTGLLSGMGHWYGTGVNDPDQQFIDPLQLKHWRVHESDEYEFIERAIASGAMPIVIRHLDWYAGQESGNTNSPWADGWVRLDGEIDALAERYGTNIIYEVWNEPDMPEFFANYEGGTFEKFLEMFARVHNRIRAIEPDATIIGPGMAASFDWLRLHQFMEFCVSSNLTVQGLSLHLWDVDPSFEDMRDDLLRVRSEILENPDYSSVGMTRIYATEYAKGSNDPEAPYGHQRNRPGSNLAMMRFMEKGGVDGATSSCWDHPAHCLGQSTCFDGTLAGLLTCDRSAPRPLWWTQKWYVDGAAARVAATSSNGQIVPLASNRDGTGQVILASRGYNGVALDMTEVTVELNNLVAGEVVAEDGTHEVWVYRAPFGSYEETSAALWKPILITNTTVTVSGGNASLTLSNEVNAYDAVLIVFEEPVPVDFRPYGTWTGDSNNDLNTALNWTGKTVPASGAIATWSGQQAGSQTLTLAADVGGDDGWKLDFTADQVDNLVIQNTSASTQNLRLRTGDAHAQGNSLDIAAGAGAVTIGGGENAMEVVLGPDDDTTGTAEIRNNSANKLTFASNAALIRGGSGARNLWIRGTGDVDILGDITLTGTGNLSMWGSGTLRLEGSNTAASIFRAAGNGTVVFTRAAAVDNFTEFRIGFTGQSGVLRYEGSENATLTRRVRVGEGNGTGAIEASGSGTLSFSHANFIIPTPSSAHISLTLDGTNTGANTISGKIINHSSSDATRTLGIIKEGTGRWILSGANTYGGTTTVNEGTLIINGNQGGATNTVTVASGAAIGGNGTIGGSLVLQSGARFAFASGSTLTVNGASANLGTLSIARIDGLDSSTAAGVYPLLDGTATFDASSVLNFGQANAAVFGNKAAWFELSGNTLNLHVQDGVFTFTDDGVYATITGYNGPAGLVRVPETLGGFTVTAIGANAFQNKTAITHITLPAGVTDLGSYAFAGMSALEWISFRGDAPSLGMGVFDGSSPLLFYRKSATGWNEETGFGGLDLFRWDIGMNALLGRGINFGNSFDAPCETCWGNPWQPEYFETIGAEAFNHLRLPVRWEPADRSMNVPPYTIYPVFLERIREVVDKALEEGLPMVLNMHHHDELFYDDISQTNRFVAQWAQIAEYFNDYREDQLFFELMNEPHDNVTPEIWNDMIVNGLAEVRAVNPDRIVLIGLARRGGINGLADLVLPADDALILTPHYYEPFTFTHQSSHVPGSEAWAGTRWRDSDIERQVILDDLAIITDFAEAHDIPVYLGEFGAIQAADLDSRVRYLRFLTRTFESLDMSWAVWQFTSGFTVTDPDTKQFIPELLNALLHDELPTANVTVLDPVYISNFSSGNDGWFRSENGGAKATLTGGGGELSIDVTTAGTAGWHVQLTRNGLNLVSNKTYRVTITGSSPQGRNAGVYISESGKYNAYSTYQTFSFPSGGVTHTFFFTMNQADDPNARITFDLGLQTGELILTEVKVEQYDVLFIPEVTQSDWSLDPAGQVVISLGYKDEGHTYTLQRSTNLVEAVWQDLETIGNPLVWTNDLSPAFFRIKAE